MSDHVALVTGAGGTIGSAICARLLADGQRVVLADIQADGARAVAARIDPDGTRTCVVEVDVTSEPSVRAMVEAATAWGGSLDVLVNNAGVTEPLNPTWQMPLADWDRTLAVNLSGTFYGCRSALPGMIERGWGRIVNISSIAGKEGKNNPVAYAAAKAGVIGLTKAVAFEAAAYNVLVNVVTPGSIWSPNWARFPDGELEAYRKRHPVGRFGRPEEVAALVAWLCSDACSFSTGAVFDVSGGRAGY